MSHTDALDESQITTKGSDMHDKPSNTGAGALFRLHMGGTAFVSWLIAVMEPKSMLAQAAAASGASMSLLLLTLVIGLLAVTDVVINDLLPDPYHWRVALNQRHFIMVGMAFCYMAQLYVTLYSMQSTGLSIWYVWNAGSIMCIAFVDAHQRSKVPRHDRRGQHAWF